MLCITIHQLNGSSQTPFMLNWRSPLPLLSPPTARWPLFFFTLLSQNNIPFKKPNQTHNSIQITKAKTTHSQPSRQNFSTIATEKNSPNRSLRPRLVAMDVGVVQSKKRFVAGRRGHGLVAAARRRPHTATHGNRLTRNCGGTRATWEVILVVFSALLLCPCTHVPLSCKLTICRKISWILKWVSGYWRRGGWNGAFEGWGKVGVRDQRRVWKGGKMGFLIQGRTVLQTLPTL